MKWNTAISEIRDGDEYIRGYKLTDLISKKSFSEICFLVLRGELPSVNEARMMDALLISAIDHGAGPPSTTVARTVVSTGNSIHTAVASGILSMGEKHGGAAEGSAKFFQDNKNCDDIEKLVEKMKERKERIPGYGHKVLKVDNRANCLIEVAKDTNIYGKHCELAESVRDELNKTKSLPLNIDGAMGAIISDMGFDWRESKGIFIISRITGLVAHTTEELLSDFGIRRIDEEYITYSGITPRKL
jgi:citryl-CoA lyase